MFCENLNNRQFVVLSCYEKRINEKGFSKELLEASKDIENSLVKKYMRLLELNPDEFIYHAKSWFGVSNFLTLNQMNYEENKVHKFNFVAKIIKSIEEKVHIPNLENITKTLHRMWKVRSLWYSDYWDGYTPNMFMSSPNTISKISNLGEESNGVKKEKTSTSVKVKGLRKDYPGYNEIYKVVDTQWYEESPCFYLENRNNKIIVPIRDVDGVKYTFLSD